MTHRNLSAVGARLEEAFLAHASPEMSPLEQYELYELIAIQVLDSEFDDFEDGQLEGYLFRYLNKKQKELLI